MVPVQLNRSSIDGKSGDRAAYQLSHLRGSGSLEQDADIVLALQRHRLEGTDPEAALSGPEIERAKAAPRVIVDLAVLKNRDGAHGSYPLSWNKPTGRFEEIAAQANAPRFTSEGVAF